MEPLALLGSDDYKAVEAGSEQTFAFSPAVPVNQQVPWVIAIATDNLGRSSEASPPTYVPEPGYWAGLSLGFVTLLVLGRRRSDVASCMP